jgi:hypothetical protein
LASIWSTPAWKIGAPSTSYPRDWPVDRDIYGATRLEGQLSCTISKQWITLSCSDQRSSDMQRTAGHSIQAKRF